MALVAESELSVGPVLPEPASLGLLGLQRPARRAEVLRVQAQAQRAGPAEARPELSEPLAKPAAREPQAEQVRVL